MPDPHNSPSAAKKDFFISYTSADLPWARWIDAQLKSVGKTTVIQCVDFLAGGDFLTEMDKAVRECHRLMPVFSPAHFRSPFCQLERNTYLALDPDGSLHLILPVVVEPCDDLGLFRSRIHVNISAMEEPAASAALLAAVEQGHADLGPVTFPGKGKVSSHPSATAVFPRSPLPPNNLAAAGIVKNEGYIPRAAQMEQLESAIASGSTVALTQALQGDGGFGKTEIAKAFLYAHAHDFAGLWWVDASAAGHLFSTDRLATALGIDFPQDCDRDQLRLAICDKLSQARHLLVLDNLDDPAVLAAWPVQPPAVRLVTTRLHGAAIDRLHPVEVSALTPGEARSLLRQHRADLADAEHDAALDAIAAELGHHALAVALAGAWLANHPTHSPAELLNGLREESHKISQEVLQVMNPYDALGERYARGVFATLTLHLGELRHPWSRTVLEIAAFLHPGGIPLDLLAFLSIDWPLHAPDSVDDEEAFAKRLDAIREAIGELHARSLLALDDGALLLHRLAQRAIRAGMNPDHRRAALRYVLAGLARLLADANNPMKLARHAPFLPHAAATLELARDPALHAEAGNLAVKLGCDSQHRADYAAALAAFEQTERHFRAAFGDEHAQVALALNNRGEMLRAKGDLDGALRCYEEAERIDRKAFGNDHPNVATRVNNRGGVLQAKGDLDGALRCFEEAERIDRKAFGNDHPKVAIRVNNRGGVLRAKGDLDGALRCFEEAERIDRKAFGNDHPEVATDVNNRGSVLQAKGDLDGALRCFEEAERIGRKAFGNDHPNVAAYVNNRGSVLRAKGDLDGALRCYEEAERIDRKAFGNDHPDVARDVNNRGSVLRAKGDLDGARACFREAFSICLRKLGPRAGNTLAGAGNLLVLGLDPLALARELAGEDVAAEFERHFREWLKQYE